MFSKLTSFITGWDKKTSTTSSQEKSTFPQDYISYNDVSDDDNTTSSELTSSSSECVIVIEEDEEISTPLIPQIILPTLNEQQNEQLQLDQELIAKIQQMNKDAILQVELDDELKKLEQLIIQDYSEPQPPQIHQAQLLVIPTVENSLVKEMTQIENSNPERINPSDELYSHGINFTTYIQSLGLELQRQEDTHTFLQRLREELDESESESESIISSTISLHEDELSDCSSSLEQEQQQEDLGKLFEMQIEKLLHEVWQQNKLYEPTETSDDDDILVDIEVEDDDDDAAEDDEIPTFEWPEQIIVEEFLTDIQFPKKFNFDWSN